MCFALLVQVAAAASPVGAQSRVITIDPAFEVADHRIADCDGDGRAELIVVARDGRVRTWRPLESTQPPQARGALTLPAPNHVLLDIATWNGATWLVAETPLGTSAYALDSEGTISATPAPWIPRARFVQRVEAPSFASIVQDVNRDGTADIVVPTLAGCELWLGSLDAGAATPKFRKAATVAVEILRWGSHDAEQLSDELESSFAMPGLDTHDVNGDGRPDLIVTQEQRRAFHLQREDGSFPLECDVQVDLAIFRDTTEAASLHLGGTLSGGEDASYSSSDLDLDGIPDYVIGHRRKVWVFRGTKDGPQFKEPSAILKTAEDITTLVVLSLDDDERPDLLLVKVQIPTLATLLRGLFGEWDVRIRALGYRNKGDATFVTAPTWQNELTLRLPGIIGLIKNPERILERFEGIAKRFRRSASGDVDGDGAEDVMLVSEDDKLLELWRGKPGEGSVDGGNERELRAILFDDANKVWDLERALAALGNFAERRIALRTGGRAADRGFGLRDPVEAAIATFDCADFDGDGRDELIVGYRRASNRRAVIFDVIAPQKGR